MKRECREPKEAKEPRKPREQSAPLQWRPVTRRRSVWRMYFAHTSQPIEGLSRKQTLLGRAFPHSSAKGEAKKICRRNLPLDKHSACQIFISLLFLNKQGDRKFVDQFASVLTFIRRLWCGSMVICMRNGFGGRALARHSSRCALTAGRSNMRPECGARIWDDNIGKRIC